MMHGHPQPPHQAGGLVGHHGVFKTAAPVHIPHRADGGAAGMAQGFQHGQCAFGQADAPAHAAARADIDHGGDFGAERLAAQRIQHFRIEGVAVGGVHVGGFEMPELARFVRLDVFQIMRTHAADFAGYVADFFQGSVHLVDARRGYVGHLPRQLGQKQPVGIRRAGLGRAAVILHKQRQPRRHFHIRCTQLRY